MQHLICGDIQAETKFHVASDLRKVLSYVCDATKDVALDLRSVLSCVCGATNDVASDLRSLLPHVCSAMLTLIFYSCQLHGLPSLRDQIFIFVLRRQRIVMLRQANFVFGSKDRLL